MNKFDLVLKNGIIVTGSDVYEAEIGVKDGVILEIGENLASEADSVYDAKGNYIFPGGIDAHTHLDMPFGGTYSSDDFETGTKAAAVGGTTSLIDFAVQQPEQTLHDTIDMWQGKAKDKACIDYGLHLAVTIMNDTTRKEIPEVIKEGYPTFKVFMVYPNMMVDDETFIDVLDIASNNGGLVSVHPENQSIVARNTERLLEAGKTDPIYHAISRPDYCEAEATNRAINLAKMADTPLYIVHASNEKVVSEIAKARQEGYPIMGETCPQYLLLSEDNYREENFNGAKYVMSPPLRDKENWDYMWSAVKEGYVQTIATDHCPFMFDQKKMGIDDFSKIPNGGPGLQLRMALMFTYGVQEGRLTLEDYVNLTSTNVAKIFGMYPEKGSIIVGSDADFMILDPNKETKISTDMIRENVDYTIFDGFDLKGLPVATFSRGELIAEDGEYVGSEARGKFVARKKPQIL